jgi:hypothetical protein
MSDLRSPVLRVACALCERSGRYNVERLWRVRVGEVFGEMAGVNRGDGLYGSIQNE